MKKVKTMSETGSAVATRKRAQGKGNGPVSTKFVPPADLTNADLQKGRTDGYWQSYMSVGGAVMPSYGEALSAEERWHVVNFLRTLAQR
jgi:mono/diheme cytochrome c family protein